MQVVPLTIQKYSTFEKDGQSSSLPSLTFPYWNPTQTMKKKNTALVDWKNHVKYNVIEPRRSTMNVFDEDGYAIDELL